MHPSPSHNTVLPTLGLLKSVILRGLSDLAAVGNGGEVRSVYCRRFPLPCFPLFWVVLAFSAFLIPLRPLAAQSVTCSSAQFSAMCQDDQILRERTATGYRSFQDSHNNTAKALSAPVDWLVIQHALLFVRKPKCVDRRIINGKTKPIHTGIQSSSASLSKNQMFID